MKHVLRPLAVRATWTDEEIAHVLTALSELREHLRQPCALAQAGMSTWTQRAVSAVHTATWFQLPSQRDYVATSRGSRPGDCFADVIFSFVMARLLHCLQQDFLEHEIVEQVPIADPGLQPSFHAGYEPHLGPVWMDDLCLLFSGKDAEELTRRVQCGVSLFLDRCKGFAFTPNMDRGKTEIILALKGRGTRRLKQQIFGGVGPPQLNIVCEHGTVPVNVVGSYQHLGGQVHHAGKSLQEIRARLAQAHTAFSQHRKVLYHNTAIDFSKRRQLFTMLVLSKLTYAMESWVTGTDQEIKTAHAGIMRLYKRFLRVPQDSSLSDEAVLTQLGMPSPLEVLRRSRLRYIGQLFACIDAVPWGLIQQDEDWLNLLRADFQWMWTQLKETSFLQDPDHHFAQWQEVITYSPRYWKRLVNRACEHAVRQRRLAYDVEDFHRRLSDLLCEQGTFLPPQFELLLEQPDKIHACVSSQRWFVSKAALGAHMFKRHGVCSKVRRLFDQTSCSACLKEFHTVKRLQAHLRGQRVCRQQLIGAHHHHSPLPGIGSTQDEQLERRRDGLIPTLQAAGPLMPARLGVDDDDEHAIFRTACAELLLDYEAAEGDLEAKMKALVAQYVLTWDQLCFTLRKLLQELVADDETPLQVNVAELHRVIGQLLQPDRWEFAQNVEKRAMTSSAKDHEEWIAACAQQPDTGCFDNVRPQPMLGRHRVVLHAFAGRRRLGDFQHYLDFFAQSLGDGIVLHTISVDIVISARHGDLASRPVQEFWLGEIRAGRIHGFLAGPPCSTWSRARGVALFDDQGIEVRGPRVVRTCAALWGNRCLSLRELEAVHLGNCLLQFCILALFNVLYIGGFGLVERPDLLDADVASIWHLTAIHLLLRYPGAREHRVQQGHFGAPSSKPTRLLAVNLHTLERSLKGWQLTSCTASATTVGKSSQGTYNTAPLKEYPPSMCAGLAQAFFRAFDKPCHADATGVDSSFVQLCTDLTQTHRGHFVGADTAGTL